MEELKEYKELKELIEGIQTAVKMYNELNTVPKLTVSEEVQRKDVTNVFVCSYETMTKNESVGLFSEHKYYAKRSLSTYDCGSIYVGLNSKYIGIINYFCAITATKENEIGVGKTFNKRTFVSNCKLNNVMSFDDMRLIMYNEGKIGPFQIGKATEEEILQVLSFASSYYGLTQEQEKEKVRK